MPACFSRPLCVLLVSFSALAATVGVGLEVWGAADRAATSSGDSAKDLDARARAARERPSAAAYASLARSQAAAGLASEAATSAVIASRLAPNDKALATAAEGYVDAALRAKLRDVVRPIAALGAGFLALALVSARRRERRMGLRDAALDRARGRLVLGVEGDGEARADTATLRARASALVIDVHGDATLATLPDPPPLVVALSHAGDGRTVRLSPRPNAGGAARFRVEGSTLSELVAHPGRWRVLVRAGPALIAEGRVDVDPTRRCCARDAA